MEEKDNTQFPEHIFIIPMRGCPVFPGLLTTIEVSDPLDLEVVKYSDRYNGFGLLLLKNEDKGAKDLSAEDFYSVGTFVKVKNKVNTIYGTKSLYLDTICRFEVEELYCNKGLVSAKVHYIKEEPLDELEDRAYSEAIKHSLALRDDRSILSENVKFNATNIPEAIRIADYLASTIVKKEKQQIFLETLDPKKRIMMLLSILRDDLKVQQMQEEIRRKVSGKIDARQREYFLREELRIIKNQLESIGAMSDDEVSELSDEDIKTAAAKPRKKLIDRLRELHLTGEAYETVFNEYSKLQGMDTANPEYSSIRSYLETVANLPWNTFTEEKLSIEKARKILEKDHYGIKDVKDRIIEFLAVRKLKEDTKGSIICLVGPPGTGKTSIGVSIAKALNKKYYRFSVGGMRDEAEIKGHRRTYIGSMPGQIIKGLKVTKTKNPVFVIDEVDKMASSNQGDPASALLEVLDPEQNTSFRDHYLDIPFDVSNVLFIVTANTVDTIPRPLLDRMECIELSGYTSDEKLHIGKKYLVPKSLAKHGLKKTDIKYSDAMLRKIAEEYAREAGVRNFEKALDKIHRKLATEIVIDDGLRAKGENPDTLMKRPVVIDEELLLKYLGQPVFHEDEVIRADKVGMSVGLAWTSMGGDVLSIEAQHIPGKGELKLTGQLGDVMQESANIALSYIKSISKSHGINLSWFEKNNIHLHVPEGATPKDGPSAGITMATAIYSLVTGQIMAKDMAMTGELSLLGKVMPIGGLKEKVLAARRNKVKTILIPKFNKRDLDKLEDNVKEGIDFHLVSDMEEVLSLAFPQDKFAYSDKNDLNTEPEIALEEKLAKAVATAVAAVLGK